MQAITHSRLHNLAHEGLVVPYDAVVEGSSSVHFAVEGINCHGRDVRCGELHDDVALGHLLTEKNAGADDPLCTDHGDLSRVPVLKRLHQ